MKFRTEYTAPRASISLSPQHPVLLTGSCFADNISGRMRQSLWKGVNPAGTLFNPISIARYLSLCLEDCEEGERAFEESLFASDGKVLSWLFNSRVSGTSKEECLEVFRKIRQTTLSTMADAECLIITFGTAWIYALRREEENYVVANCHRQPSGLFERRRMEVGEICELWHALTERLLSRFRNLRIIFTVSPVRHLKDGFEENMRSKATLILAVEQLCHDIPECYYFPAYEIVNDDLRDYRFYATDLAHPSEQAVEYIWEKFCVTYLSDADIRRLAEGKRIWSSLQHRPALEDAASAELRRRNVSRLEGFIQENPGMGYME